MTRLESSPTTQMMLSGILLVGAGILSIASPAVAGKAVVFVVGAFMALSGAAQVYQGVRSERWSSRMPPMILGTVLLIGGLAVLAHPLFGLEALSLVLAMFFGVEGLWKILTSFSYRPAFGWMAMLISGVTGLLLGWLIWKQWPLSGLWAVGVFVGIDLLTTGVALIVLSTTIRRLKQAIQDSVTAG